MLTSRHEDSAIRSASNDALHAVMGSLIHTPVLVNSGPAARAKSAVTASYEFKNGLAAAYDALSRQKPPSSLTPEAAAEALADARQVIAEWRDHVVADLADHANEARSEAQKAADPHRLKLDENNVAQLTRTSQAWEHSIKPQLEKGKSWDQIIPGLDADGLLAVQRFAPSHERATRTRQEQHEVPEAIAGIERQITRQAALTAPEGGPREALAAEDETEKFVSAAGNTLNALTQFDGGRDAALISMSVTRATFAVGAQPGQLEAASTAA